MFVPTRRAGWVAAPFVAHAERRAALTQAGEEGEVILASVSPELPYDQRVRMAVEYVTHFSPRVVFSYGNWNLAGDLLSQSFPVVQQPSSGGTAMSLGDVLLFADRQGGTEPPNAGLLPRQHGAYRPYAYIDNRVDEAPALSRSELNLPEDRLLFALVGNRLPAELAAPFLAGLSDLLESRPTLDLVLIGHALDEPPEAFAAFCDRYRRRIWNLGYQRNLIGAYGAVDAYLNPFRQGGGHSVYMAMRAGLPVLALDDGDASEHLGAEQTVKTATEYFLRARTWAEDPALRASAAEEQGRRAQAIPTLSESYPALESFMQSAVKRFAVRTA